MTSRFVSGPDGVLTGVWTAECDSPTGFSSLATSHPGIGFARIGGKWAVHLRGPATKASPMTCPADAEFFGSDFRLGAYLPMFPPARLSNLRDAILPTLSDGRILLDGRAWEMPTPDNLDVFFTRLERAGLLAFDPVVEELRHGVAVRRLPERTAQSRFVRAVGLSRRKLQLIERARHAVHLLHGGVAIAEVVTTAGFYDQPQLTRSLRQLIGHTPAEVARGTAVLGL
ncbi:helix-turn-helix domain-containing protein [Kribbella sp. NPDC051952]|uniref:helix-turn-helix domain-containing protein n=1 Tax=Kribbella sp. NPDC051952 TaxID=3154851 RepID=UPI003421E1A1